MASRNKVNIERIVALRTLIADLGVRTWFTMAKNLNIDVLLEASFMDQCIRRIFLTEHEMVPWLLKPMENISTKTATSLINPDKTFSKKNGNSQDEASSETHIL